MKDKDLDIGRCLELVVENVEPRHVVLIAGSERLLLERDEVPAGLKPGERVRVFLQRSETGQPVATTRLPLAGVGEFAALRIKRQLRAGVIFDLGNGYELPVAREEIPFRPRPEERPLVYITLDEDENLCGSCRIADFLSPPRGLKVGEAVELQVWRQTELGIKMIVNGACEGLLYAEELSRVRPGERMTGYIRQLRADGKLDLSLNPGGRAGVDIGREKLLAALEPTGFLPLHDGSSPEEIRSRLGLSKKQFKRAVGTLYREQKIELLTKGIRLVGKSKKADEDSK